MLTQTEDGLLGRGYRSILNQLIYSLKSGNIKTLIGIICYYLMVNVAFSSLESVRNLLIKLRGVWPQEKWFIVNNYKMILTDDEKGIMRDLRVHNIREPFSTKYFNELIKDDDIIIDIGANIGYYVILESITAHLGKVYAIEPVEFNMQILNKNLELNGRRNIIPLTMALGDSKGKKNLYVYAAGNLSSFIKHDLSKIIKQVETEVMTLDSFIQTHVKERPDVIRMDLEGYECQIIEGANNILSNGENLTLFIEIHPSLASPERIEEMLKALETGCFRVDAIFVEPRPCEFEFISLANVLRGFAGMPKYGCAGGSFQELRDLLSGEILCRVFFSRHFQTNT